MIKSRIKSMLKPALLAIAASLICAAPAQAIFSTRNFSNVLFNSNWVGRETYATTSTLQIFGFGQWFCSRGNGTLRTYTEYDAYIDIKSDVLAVLNPHMYHDCQGFASTRYRKFTLRLLVERHIAGDFTPYYDKTISWQGHFGTDERDLVYTGVTDNNRWRARAFTTVEGQGTLFGVIDFTDN
jgi:hypothetical protein